MSQFHKNPSAIKISVICFPANERFNFYFDDNQSFFSLRNYMYLKKMIRGVASFFVVGDETVIEDGVLKYKGVENGSVIKLMKTENLSDYRKIDELKDELERKKRSKMLVDFKVIKADENAEVNVCENNPVFLFNHNNFYYITEE